MIDKFKKFSLGLIACLAFISFSACGDDENEPTPDPKPEKVTASVSYAFSCQSDLLLATDITVTYANAEGKDVSEAVTEKEWKKEVTNVAVPFTAKLNITYAKKEGFTPEKAIYNFGDGYGIGYKASNGKTESYSSVATSLSISNSRVNEYLDLLISGDHTKSTEIK